VKSITLYALLGLILMVSAGQTSARDLFCFGKDGSKDIDTREYELDSFDEIVISDVFLVNISFGDEPSLKLTIDDNLMDSIGIRIRGDKLRIGFKDKICPTKRPALDIVVTSLSSLSTSGAVDMVVSKYRGDSLSFELAGAGTLEIDGEVGDFSVNVSGAGEVDARDLIAENVDINMSGAASADIFVTGRLDADVSGVGSVEYWGNPEKRNTQVSGIGSIKRRGKR